MASARFLTAAILAGLGCWSAAIAAEPPLVELRIKDHKFQPERVEIPKDVKVRLAISNLDPTAEEFESTELHREKIVPAGQTVTLLIGPLDAGDYRFFGDFHQETARGTIRAK